MPLNKKKPPAKTAEKIFTARSVAETEKLARKIAAQLRPGAVIALNGDLGAGKTTLTRALVKALGNTASVVSPTFTILNIYAGKMPVYHFDFYRLQNLADLENTGGTEFIPSSDGITIIEWAEKIPEILPLDYLAVNIRAGAGRRRIFTLEPHGLASGKILLASLVPLENTP